MALSLKISVPNISSLLPTYDVIRVFRSSVSKDGPFTEITSLVGGTASITGSASEPFADLNGKTLILKTSDQNGSNPDIVVSFTDANPVTLAQVIAAINSSGANVTASASGSSVAIATNATGQTAKIQIMGGTALADLGFSLYQSASGTDSFISLIPNQSLYTLMDPAGQDTDWYRWQFYNTSTLASSALTIPIHPQDALIDPNRKIQDFRATKGLTLVRGREHTFRLAFWADQAQGIPLTPDGSGQYPIYSIFDINGELVATGKADLDGSAPNYKAVFLVPQDAVLSNDDRQWRIEWFMLTDTGRQIQTIDEFSVRDVDVTETESRDQRYLAAENFPYRLRLRLPREVTSISLTITESESSANVTIPTTSTISSVIDGDTVVYFYDIPANKLKSAPYGKSYTALWQIQETPASGTDIQFQIIDVPPYRVARFFVSLRQEIDKAQKKRGLIQAYEDSDIFEYLRQGLNYINGVYPANLSYSLITIPPIMEPYWLMASLLWGLQAQQLCEIDVAFAFSGQQVTLDYDRSSALESAISRAIQLLDSSVKQTKMYLLRSTSTVGAYAGRSYRITGNNNYVYQLSAGGSQSFLSLLQSVGLL